MKIKIIKYIEQTLLDNLLEQLFLDGIICKIK